MRLIISVLAVSFPSVVLAALVLISTGGGSSSSEGSDFASRCAESGVVICKPLDDDGEITSYLWNNSEGWDSDRSSSGSEYATFVADDGCRGTGALQIQDRPGDEESNIYLNFPLSGAASGNAANSSDIDYVVPVGTTVWAQFCYLMTQTQYDNEDSTAWIGHKIGSFTSEFSSNTDQEGFVMRNAGRKYISVSNSNVDAEDQWLSVDEGAYIDVQPGSDYGLCKYNEDDPILNDDTCYMIVPGTWYSVLMGLTPGAIATPGVGTQDGTTHVRVYMAKSGDLSYTKIFDRSTLKVYDYDEPGPGAVDGYSGFILWNRHECDGSDCISDGTKASGLSQKFSDLIVKVSVSAPPLPDWDEWSVVSEPTYLTDMNVGFWYEMSGPSPDLSLSATNVLEDTDPALDNVLNPGMSQGSESWTVGGAYISNQFSYNGAVAINGVGPDDLGGLAFVGAGHNTYLGNHVSVWWASTRTWERLNDPFLTPSSTGSWPNGYYSDNSPVLPHTYNYLLWHPTLQKIIVPAVEVNHSGGGEIRKVALFDVDTKVWTYTASEGTRGYAGFAAYDSTRDRLLVEGTASSPEFSTYDFDGTGIAGTWNHCGSVKYNGANMSAAFNPVDDVMLVLHTDETVRTIDGANACSSSNTATEAGSGLTSHDTAGLVYSPNLDAFIAYNRGENVYKLQHTSGSLLTGTYTWSNLTDGTNTTTPPDGDANDVGVYGRFQLLRYGTKEMVCVFNQFDGPVYCMRVN